MKGIIVLGTGICDFRPLGGGKRNVVLLGKSRTRYESRGGLPPKRERIS